MQSNQFTKFACWAIAALAFGCGDDNPGAASKCIAPDCYGGSGGGSGDRSYPVVGVGEVDGLPGTPLARSVNGVPIIEGVERYDYADDGINSFAQRWERRALDNPTGEYRFPVDQLGEKEWVVDADDRAGFRNGLEEYTWRLTHPDVLHEKGTWRSNVFHGKAFSTNSDGSLNALGACWLTENSGKDCEFPSGKSFTWRLRFGNKPDESFSTCSRDPSVGGTHAPGFYTDPSQWIQEAFDKWNPEAKMTKVTTNEQVSVWCEPMPGSVFGAILGRSGGSGATVRRVTNAHDAYSCNPSGGAAFPRGLYTYGNGDIRYSADNMHTRSLLCGADPNNSEMFHVPAVNMFMHELGHFLGFSHFSTGAMATGGDCGMFYSVTRTVPQSFHDAMANFSPTSGTFNFIAGGGCSTPSALPTPLNNANQFPFGRLYQ